MKHLYYIVQHGISSELMTLEEILYCYTNHIYEPTSEVIHYKEKSHSESLTHFFQRERHFHLRLLDDINRLYFSEIRQSIKQFLITTLFALASGAFLIIPYFNLYSQEVSNIYYALSATISFPFGFSSFKFYQKFQHSLQHCKKVNVYLSRLRKDDSLYQIDKPSIPSLS